MGTLIDGETRRRACPYPQTLPFSPAQHERRGRCINRRGRGLGRFSRRGIGFSGRRRLPGGGCLFFVPVRHFLPFVFHGRFIVKPVIVNGAATRAGLLGRLGLSLDFDRGLIAPASALPSGTTAARILPGGRISPGGFGLGPGVSPFRPGAVLPARDVDGPLPSVQLAA